MPKHADTMPSSSKTENGTPQTNESPSTVRDMAYNQGNKETSQDSGTGTSDTVVDPQAPSDGKPRRRKFPFTHGKGTEEEGQVPRRQSSMFKKDKQKFTLMSQLRATILNSWINVLLIFVPIGIAVNYANVPKVGVFVINFIAIIPLAAMLSYATEEIALRTGETIGGLLNATFG